MEKIQGDFFEFVSEKRPHLIPLLSKNSVHFASSVVNIPKITQLVL